MAVISLSDYQPSERYDGVPWNRARIEASAASTGPWTTRATITLDPADDDPAEPATRNFTITTAQAGDTWFRVAFLDVDDNTEFTTPVFIGRQSFATVEDVEIRAGRDLNDDEQASANQILVGVTGMIISAVSRDEDWMRALDPVPSLFKTLCVEKAFGAVSNPGNVAVNTETLGAHSVSQIYRRSGMSVGVGDVTLKSDEERACREIVRDMYDVSQAEPDSILTEIDDNQLSGMPSWVTSYEDGG